MRFTYSEILPLWSLNQTQPAGLESDCGAAPHTSGHRIRVSELGASSVVVNKPGALAPEACWNAGLNWTRADHYEGLRHADRSAFAWEWLRRTPAYRDAWRRFRTRMASPRQPPREFGLERFEDPGLSVPLARPLWRADIDPSVIRAVVLDPFAHPADRIDLWRLMPLVSVAIDDKQIEHLLLSNGIQSLRIDIVDGTLIGNPASLRFGLHGIAALQGPVAALRRLIEVVEKGGFDDRSIGRPNRRERWILELRVADALLAGAGYQQIARGLFGDAIAGARWRTQNPSHRQRVLRLAKAAKLNLAFPLDRKWFSDAGAVPNEPA